MNHEDVKIGMRVVPHSKTVGCPLEESGNWEQGREQGFLYVGGYDTDERAWILSSLPGCPDGDFYNSSDFERFEEKTSISPMGSAIDDPVDHPSHYTTGKIEVIDFIEDQKLEFHLANALKYICRAGKKNPDKTIEDLEKAVWYIKRKVKVLTDAKTTAVR